MYEEADLFLDAQDSVWSAVVLELSTGKKTSHWMWFVFPQLASLGQSHMSQLYGLHDLTEAQEYLSDPTLRSRLEEVAGLMLLHRDRSAKSILGAVDARKLQSCMTLFSKVAGSPTIFADVLDMFYAGQPCQATLTEIDAG